MREKIDCFLACDNLAIIGDTLGKLRESKTIQHIYLLVSAKFAKSYDPPTDCDFIVVDSLTSTDTIMKISEKSVSAYALMSLKTTPFLLEQHAPEHFIQTAVNCDAPLVYSDYYSVANSVTSKHSVIDYQQGSVRDDFDFGQIVLIKSELLHDYASKQPRQHYKYAGFYDLRLYLSRQGDLFHLKEYLYTEQELDTRKSGEKQFDYVNPQNRDVQVEMEQAVTEHLRAIGALVDTVSYIEPDFNEHNFECEASVIIPVFNRAKTIKDAVLSALCQEADFAFNVIVVDNHSTDGTTNIINELANDERLIHIIPERTDLGIGGCWNVAIDDKRCGRFAVQLDSDDLYSSAQTLSRIVEAFHRQHAAMIVGSYRMCDFNLQTLPPGLIDHKEWTDQNGANNALRINGLGAPRAFFTPLARAIHFPNTSYGEDYAMGLAFSRKYKIGRIYDELYLCRRWNGNSDSALSIEKVNANNLYKDSLRTSEIAVRRKMNSNKPIGYNE